MKSCPKLLTPLLSIPLSFLIFASPIIAAAPDGAGPWADSVVSTAQGLTKGGGAVPLTRSDPNAALGVAENNTIEGNFYSLGFGGVLTLGFVNGISSGVIIIEATNPGYPNESANVEVSANGTTWVPAGSVVSDGNVNVPQGISCVQYVRITDTSNTANFEEASADGYDVDGVQGQGEPCTPPSPSPSPTPSITPHPSSTPTPGGGSCGCSNTTVKQTNFTNVSTGVTNIANTGKNSSNFNTGGSSVVTTGGAVNLTSISVQSGSNSATLNQGCCCTGGTNIISNNGAGSINTINNNATTLNTLNTLKTLKKF